MSMTRDNLEIRIGLGSCCQASGSGDVCRAIQAELARLGATDVALREGACLGMCHRVPLVEFIEPDGQSSVYGNVTPASAVNIVRRHVQPGGSGGALRSRLRDLARKFISDAAWLEPEEFRIRPDESAAMEFLDPQIRIVTAGAGATDPTDLAEYRADGGYDALERIARDDDPDAMIDRLERAGLRGRGGAGYPTALKWRHVRRAEGETKYAVCNGDEGDPGAFMDRMLLEGYPHRVLEGLAIAALTVGAGEAILYIRQEYPLAVQRVQAAIDAATAAGLLGPDVCGRGRSLQISIRQGSGAFVCGEETALLASIEGKRGTPRLRPPYPAERGLFGKPTLVSNVETYANVPWIVRHGPEAFAAIGTGRSKGTKVFSLTGKVACGGLIEVPMGTTIERIVNEIGGGIKQGKTFKAVQIGGPSGGCIPAAMADTPVDYEALLGVGAMMGSGGLVVLDDSDCMVDIARYFLQFTQHESCGRCTFCRIGTMRMLEILNRLCNGLAEPGELDELEQLAHQVARSSLCGLGKTAPNPVLTTLQYYREEYQAHLQGRCPAHKCTALLTYSVTDDCIGCTKCAKICPVDAIEEQPYKKHYVDMGVCTRCHMCVPICPVDAIRWE